MSDSSQVRQALLDALSVIHGSEEVDRAIAGAASDYMLELDSKTAEYLLVAVEDLVGHALPCPADLDPTDYNSLGSLLDLIIGEME